MSVYFWNKSCTGNRSLSDTVTCHRAAGRWRMQRFVYKGPNVPLHMCERPQLWEMIDIRLLLFGMRSVLFFIIQVSQHATTNQSQEYWSKLRIYQSVSHVHDHGV